MIKTRLKSLLIVGLLASCNSNEKSIETACPAIGHFDSLYTTINLKSPLSDYKILVDGIEVNDDCSSLSPCISEQKIEDDKLIIRLRYEMDKIPSKMDLALIEKNDPEIVRLEAFDVQPALPAPGGLVGDSDCDDSKEAMISLEE